MAEIPSWDYFLAAADEEVALVAPTTVVISAGGSRRAAALAGISLQSDEYVHWAREQNQASFTLLFQHGIKHIVAAAITENQLNEITPVYREKLLQWTAWGLCGPSALADYAHAGWKVRLLGTETLPELQACAQCLEQNTPAVSDKNVWWFVAPEPESYWRQLIQVAQRTNAQTRDDLVMALYGADIPTASLFISYGKPLFMPAQVPPLLQGTMQSYWLQRPGYLTDKVQLRQILYDYAYLRVTWREDKTARAEEVLPYRTIWENAPTLGLGQRLGSFWLPK